MPKHSSPIQPEVLDETGHVVTPAGVRDQARAYGDMSGVLSGVWVLMVGFLTTVAVILFSVLVICPLLLLGRLFGFKVRTWKG